MGWKDMFRQNIREVGGAEGKFVGELYFGGHRVLRVEVVYSVEREASHVSVMDGVTAEFITKFTTSLAPKHAIREVFSKYKMGMPRVIKLAAVMGVGRALFGMGLLEDELIRWFRHYADILRELIKGRVPSDEMESLYRIVCRDMAGILEKPETERQIFARLVDSYKKAKWLWESYVRGLLEAVDFIRVVSDAVGADPHLDRLSKYIAAITVSSVVVG